MKIYLTIDLDGSEFMHTVAPFQTTIHTWYSKNYIPLYPGTIERLTGIEPNYEDQPLIFENDKI